MMPHVLVVDDEVHIAAFVKDLLEENGFMVTAVHTGRDGLRAAAETSPDVMLLDVDLPDMTGYDLCRALRQKSALRTRPILMLTALGDQQHELEGLRAGADDYLTKPVSGVRLVARVKAAIQRNVRELDANPLTHLPGNAGIVQEIERRLREKASFAVVYADLNNFKAFNDTYGFMRGDQALKLAAQCLVGAVEEKSAAGPCFMGHLGGDDFVAVVRADAAEDVCREAIARFDALVPGLYDEKDRKRGYIEAKSRQGQPVRFPFVGMALVIVSAVRREFSHPGEISSLASELKTWAKSYGRSAFVSDRRQTDPSEGGEAK